MRMSGLLEDISVNPAIPDGFWSHTPMEMRPEEHMGWLGRPFIQTCADPRYPGGVRFDVHCLEGGAAMDHPVTWGTFGTLEEALHCVRER